MSAESELLFQMGAIMLLAFVAATLAGKLNQSVMIGYIVIGIFIGPKMSFEIFGLEYRGFISDTSLIEILSFVGLVMLMFFVGLEFSFSKLKKTRTPAIILAIIDVSVGLFVGFIFASFLGWPLIDSIFLAGVIAMSSSSIAMKVLFDLKRMSSPEVEFLIGLVIVETFIAMLILAVASGMVVRPDSNPMEYGQLLLGMAAFYAFFIWVAMWAVPRVVSFFNSIENDELFILFALGIVFLTSGFAAAMNVPPIIGAFFIGMILAETNVSARIRSKLESFKDAFVAIFFTSFGMMIDPAMFSDVIWMVAIAIPLVLFYEIFVISSVTYFLGFSAKAATTIGTSATGRGVESILFASVGSNVQGATMGSLLNPFAGAFCFGMSAVTSVFVKHSTALANALSKVIPAPLKFSGSVISRTLGKAVMPSSIRIFKGAKITGALLLSFVILCTMILMVKPPLHLLLVGCGIIMTFVIYFVIRFEVKEIVKHVNYSNLGVRSERKSVIVDLVSWLIFGSVLSVLIVVSIWTYMWQLSLVVAISYLVGLFYLMFAAHKHLYAEQAAFIPPIYMMPRHEIKEDDEGNGHAKPLPKAVYGVVKTLPKNMRL
ncbi:MAG: cation:proton antiporter [Candidatus Thermoplasmatota archaeon]|nr:cation:proton antiporter [Candidatus Thermoplasmatota archaeon]